MNFQMFKLVLEKAEEPEVKLPTLLEHQKSKGIPKKKRRGSKNTQKNYTKKIFMTQITMMV